MSGDGSEKVEQSCVLGLLGASTLATAARLFSLEVTESFVWCDPQWTIPMAEEGKRLLAEP